MLLIKSNISKIYAKSSKEIFSLLTNPQNNKKSFQWGLMIIWNTLSQNKTKSSLSLSEVMLSNGKRSISGCKNQNN